MPEWPVWTELKGRTDPSFKKTLKGGRDELTKFKKSQDKLGGAVGNFGKLLKGLFVVAAIKRFATAINEVAVAMGNLQDEANKVGTSAAAIQGVEDAATRAGAASGSATSLMKRLNAELSRGENVSGKFAQGLAFVGENFTEFRTLSPERRIARLADAFAKLNKVQQQAAAARLGISQDFLPALAQGGGAFEAAVAGQQAVLTPEQIERSEAFKDFKTVAGFRARDVARGATANLIGAGQAVGEAGGLIPAMLQALQDGNTINSQGHARTAASGGLQ